MKSSTLAILIVCLVAVSGAGVAYYVHYKDTNKVATNIIPLKKNAPKQTPQQAAENNKPSDDIPVSPTMAVTNIQSSESDGEVDASATITGAPASAGTCVFTFSNSIAKPVTQEVDAKGDSSGLTCDTGAIPSVEFSVIGTWQLTVDYYYNNSSASANTNVTIN